MSVRTLHVPPMPAHLEQIAQGAFEACEAFSEAMGGVGRSWSSLDPTQQREQFMNAARAIALAADEPSPRGRLFVAVARAISNAIAAEKGAETAFAKREPITLKTKASGFTPCPGIVEDGYTGDAA